MLIIYEKPSFRVINQAHRTLHVFAISMIPQASGEKKSTILGRTILVQQQSDKSDRSGSICVWRNFYHTSTIMVHKDLPSWNRTVIIDKTYID